MENLSKGVLFFVLSALIIAMGVPAYAQTVVEKRKEAVNYDETLTPSDEARSLEEAAEEDAEKSAENVAEETAEVPQGAVGAGSSEMPAQAAQELPPVMSAGQNVPQENAGAMAAQSAVPQVQPQAVVSQAQTTPVAIPEKPPIAKVALPPVRGAAFQPVSKDRPEEEVFMASNPSGLVEISGYKYPVYLYAPQDYKLDRTYAMVMIAPAESIKAEQQIEYLSGLAKRQSIFILAPYVLWPKTGDTPYTLDAWLLTVKKDVIERFPINKKRVYLIGKDSGAQYAAYLAVKYPKEFAAVALLGEAWDGPFSELVRPHDDMPDQIPFYVALKKGGDAEARNRAWLDTLQKKGYFLHLANYQGDEDLASMDFKKSVFDWLEKTSQNWAAAVAKDQQHWKAKFKKGVKDFFAV